MSSLILLFVTFFLLSLSISLFFLKHFINFSKKNNILDHPDDRKTHITPTPSSGGLAFGIIIILLLPIIIGYKEYQIAIYCSVLLLVLGYLDDRYDLSAKLKFSIQIIVTIITISSIGPIILIDSNPLYFNHIFTFFFILGFTNSYNLIDGVDGLAGLYGVFILALLSFIFIIDANYIVAIITVSLMASLVAFLKFNLKSAQVFMGDTGTLLLGFLISVFAVIAINEHPVSSLYFESQYSLHIILLGALILPMVDTVRVMTNRILKGIAPFKADRSHLHHLLGKIGLTHIHISLCFLSITVFLTLTTAILVLLNLNFIFIIISIITIITILFNVILYITLLQHKKRIEEYQNSIEFIIKNNYLIKGNSLRTDTKQSI